MHYLEALAEGLCSHELHPLALPVVCLQLVLAQTIVEDAALVQLVRLRCCRTRPLFTSPDVTCCWFLLALPMPIAE